MVDGGAGGAGAGAGAGDGVVLWQPVRERIVVHTNQQGILGKTGNLHCQESSSIGINHQGHNGVYLR